MQNLQLQVGGKAHGQAVHVKFGVIAAFRFDEDGVRGAIREANDLDLDRRAIARPDPLDPPIEKGRKSEVLPNGVAGLFVCVGDPTSRLIPDRILFFRVNRKGAIIVVAHLNLDARIIDARCGNAGRRAGFEAEHFYPLGAQPLRKQYRRRFAESARGGAVFAGKYLATEKRSRSDYRGSRGDCLPVRRPDSRNPSAGYIYARGLRFDDIDVVDFRDLALDGERIAVSIVLRPRRPDRRALAPIEDAILYRREVGASPDQPAEAIHLADDLTFRKAAHRRIAAHPADGRSVERDESHAMAPFRRNIRRLDARVPPTDNNNVVSLAHEGNV